MSQMKLETEWFEGKTPRLGDSIVMRRLPRFHAFKLHKTNTSVTYQVNCLEPLSGVPVEMTRVIAVHGSDVIVRQRKIRSRI